MAGKEGYGYGGGCQYCGSSGTGHHSCSLYSSILGGMPTTVLPQSRKESYTGWDNIVGNIYTSGFFSMFLHHFYFSCNPASAHRLRANFSQNWSMRTIQKKSTTSLILPFSNIKHQSMRDGPSASSSASATGNFSANGTGH